MGLFLMCISEMFGWRRIGCYSLFVMPCLVNASCLFAGGCFSFKWISYWFFYILLWRSYFLVKHLLGLFAISCHAQDRFTSGDCIRKLGYIFYGDYVWKNLLLLDVLDFMKQSYVSVNNDIIYTHGICVYDLNDMF